MIVRDREDLQVGGAGFKDGFEAVERRAVDAFFGTFFSAGMRPLSTILLRPAGLRSCGG
jgi:hypothetical protein